jgi:4-hydroxybenzoyl-CoA reductase subunit beta
MLLPAHEFVKPASLAEALETLNASTGEVKLLAGGTDVVFNMRGRLFQPDVLLSIKDLPELQRVEELGDGSLRIGAGCRLTDLERNQHLQRHPALIKVCGAVASRHVRNMATLGGNLCLDTRCWYVNQTAQWREAKGPCLKTGVNVCHAIKSSDVCVALSASDLAPVLIALGAVTTLASASGTREVPLAEFYTGDGIAHTVRRADEIMTAVTVPPSADRVVFIKETARKGNDFSYGVVAARVDGSGESVTTATLVIGCMTTRPVMLHKTAAIIAERGLTKSAIDMAAEATRDELGPLTSLYTPAAYKGTLARTLVRRALHELRLQ